MFQTGDGAARSWAPAELMFSHTRMLHELQSRSVPEAGPTCGRSGGAVWSRLTSQRRSTVKQSPYGMSVMVWLLSKTRWSSAYTQKLACVDYSKSTKVRPHTVWYWQHADTPRSAECVRQKRALPLVPSCLHSCSQVVGAGATSAVLTDATGSRPCG